MRRIIALCLFIILSNGCMPKRSEAPSGSLELSVDLRDLALHRTSVYTFTLQLVKDSVTVTRKTTVETGQVVTITVDGIYPGSWSLWGGLAGDNGIYIYVGTKTVIIVSQTTTAEALILQPAPGFIRATANTGFLISQGLTVTSGKLYVYKDDGYTYTTMEFDSSMLVGSSRPLPPQTYDAKIFIYNESLRIYESPVFIVNVCPGRTMDILLDADGYLQVGCTPDPSPSVPSGLAAVYANGATHLSWDSNTEPDLACYLLYHANSEGRYMLLAEIPAGSISYDHLNPSPGDAYQGSWRYAIAAKDLGGNISFRCTPVCVPAP
ncbi:MAG: hypothetical protein ACM3WV_00490 [Bacillota bacterium]